MPPREILSANRRRGMVGRSCTAASRISMPTAVLATRLEILPTNSPNRTIAATISTTSCTVTMRRASSECGTIPGAPAVVSVPSAIASPSNLVSSGAQLDAVPVETYQIAKSTTNSTIAFSVASITQISER